MTEFLPRSAWTDDPRPGGVAEFDDAKVIGLAVHWPGGAGSVPTTKAASIQILEGELAFHTNPVSAGGRGWSDIAYNFAADQEGRVWDLRGMEHRSAANGDTDVNDKYVAVTCLIGPKDTPSVKLLQAVRDLRGRVLRRYPKATRVAPHSAIRPDPTDCPGNKLRAHIADGTFTSTSALDVPAAEPQEETTMKVVRVPDGRCFIVAGPISGYIATGPVLLDWCRATGQVDGKGDPQPLDVGNATLAMTTDIRTFALIQQLAGQAAAAAAQRPDVDEAALAAALGPLLHPADVDEAQLAADIVAALPAGIATQVLDGLHDRLAP